MPPRLLPAPPPRLSQIAAAIKDNRSLKLLDVGGNNIGEDGAKALAGETRLTHAAAAAAAGCRACTCPAAQRRGWPLRVAPACQLCASGPLLLPLHPPLLARCLARVQPTPTPPCSRAQGQRGAAQPGAELQPDGAGGGAGLCRHHQVRHEGEAVQSLSWLVPLGRTAGRVVPGCASAAEGRSGRAPCASQPRVPASLPACPCRLSLLTRLPPSLQLEVLGMGWCKVGSGDGVKAVADMLMYNNTIRRLDLRGNGLGNDGEGVAVRGWRAGLGRAPACLGTCRAGGRGPAPSGAMQLRSSVRHRDLHKAGCRAAPSRPARPPPPMAAMGLAPCRRHLVLPRLQGAHQRRAARAGAGVQRDQG